MRVFVAGGSGVIGRRLIPQLVAAGHEVAATTRRQAKAESLSSLGATPVVVDALDAAAVREEILRARPQVVMNQMTSLPPRYEVRRLEPWYRQTSLLRVEGTRNLLSAAQEAGATRFIYQSIAFMYASTGPRIAVEDAPLMLDAPEPFGAAFRGTAEGETLALSAPGIEGVVLRYGPLYGPGTYFDSGGDFVRQARRRMLPIVGAGLGMSSFIHVDDAAAAAVCAMTRGAGIYNIVDDDPAASRDWTPAFCAEARAPAPLRVPVWLASLMAGPMAGLMADAHGASNAKAKRELNWQPRHASWRQGFFGATNVEAGGQRTR